MKKIVFHKTVLLYCLILTSCSSSYFLNIQTYPSVMSENNIGSFDIFCWRWGANRFWITIDYDLKKELLLYKDSVNICYYGEKQDIILFKENDANNETEPMKLSEKGRLYLRFYTSDPVLRKQLGRTNIKMIKGDTVILHSNNALFTLSEVFPLDSVKFIQGEPYKFKDYFKKKKGKEKYGYYKISL